MDREQYSTQVLDAENGRESEEYIEKKEKGPQMVTGSFPGFYGKHRLQAAISHLNNQINNIQVNSLVPSSPLISLIYILDISFILFNLQK